MNIIIEKIGKLRQAIVSWIGPKLPLRKKQQLPPEKITVVESLYEWAGTLITSLIVIIFIFIFFFRIVGVVGSSMYPTLIGAPDGALEYSEGDRLLVSTFNYVPRRGDIVIIDRYVEEPIIKRVIALENQCVEIKDGKVYVDGEPDEYTMALTELKDFEPGQQYVREGYVFVLGDNRPGSKDSRYNEIGYVNKKDIIGKAFFRFSPLSRFGFVK